MELNTSCRAITTDIACTVAEALAAAPKFEMTSLDAVFESARWVETHLKKL